MSIEVTILGSSSATPTSDRHPAAQYLNFGYRQFLVDCGEGTQMQMMRFGLRFFKVESVFISHIHPDHFLGLPGLLSTLSLQKRTQPVNIFCPAELEDILNVFIEKSKTHLTYQLIFRSLSATQGDAIFEDANLRVRSFPVKHRTPCWSFLFEEKKYPRKIIKEQVAGINLPKEAYSSLRNGNNYTDESGKLYSIEEYTEPTSAPDSYAYVTDTLYIPEIAKALKGTKMIYHEATFLHELKEKAVETMHSTAKEAALFAQNADAHKLLIGHFSSRYKVLAPLLNEAREVFPETYVAEEGKTYKV